ncbi:putative reverse transcriptase domain-containing protein [Tanacetum coccineum]
MTKFWTVKSESGKTFKVKIVVVRAIKRNNSSPSYFAEITKKHGNAQAMVTAPTDGKIPLCERCFTRHLGQCTIKCHKCGKVGHKARYYKEKSVATGANAQPIWTCYDCGEQGHTRNRYPKKVKQEEVRRSFEVELYMLLRTMIRRVRFTMPLSSVVKKVVRIPYGNKTLIVKGDKGGSRLKIISCIKARKYVEQGCHLFLAHVTKKKSKEKRMKDVPIVGTLQELVGEGLFVRVIHRGEQPVLFVKKERGSLEMCIDYPQVEQVDYQESLSSSEN